MEPEAPKKRLTAEQIAAYERDGVIPIAAAVDRGAVETMRQAIEELHDDEKRSGRPKNFFKRIREWERRPALREFCLRSSLPGIAARLMATPKVNLLYDQVFVKEPGTNLPTPWHNDMPYWPIRGGRVCTLWVAFDPVTRESGGLEFIRGSHRWAARYRTFGTTLEGGMTEKDSHATLDAGYADMPDFGAARDKYDIVSFPLQPGDALAFDAMALHGAGSNTRSDVRRRGYAIRFASEAARYYDGPVHNIEIRNPSLKTGDRLDSAQYPVVYPVP